MTNPKMRIHLEAESVIFIVESARGGVEELITSDYLLAEILGISDPTRRTDVMTLLAPATGHVPQHPTIDARALQIST